MQENTQEKTQNKFDLDFWLKENIKKENLVDYFSFMISLEPEFKGELIDIQKKILKRNKSALSLLITFTSTHLKNEKNENLKLLIKKLIQTLMDNPKGLK